MKRFVLPFFLHAVFFLGAVPLANADGFPFYGADRGTVVARVLTVVYFLFFLLMPWYTARDKTKPVPARTT